MTGEFSECACRSGNPEQVANNLRGKQLYKFQGGDVNVNNQKGRHVVQLTHGCSQVNAANGRAFDVCGCREFWCKLGDNIAHPDGGGPGVPGGTQYWHVVGPCHSATQIFGCMQHGNWKPRRKDDWHKDWESPWWQILSFP